MEIRVSDVAAKQLADITRYYALHFGMQSATNIVDSFEVKMDYLAKYPEAGHPEPMAEGFSHLHRSVKIAKHLNVIYWVDYIANSVMIADIWDTRMNPERLKRRLSRKRSY